MASKKQIPPAEWRDRILACVRATPGALYSQLHYSATHGLAGTGVGRLIRQMEADGELVTKMDSKRRRYYIPGQSDTAHPLDALWANRDAIIPDRARTSVRHLGDREFGKRPPSTDAPRRREHGLQCGLNTIY